MLGGTQHEVLSRLCHFHPSLQLRTYLHGTIWAPAFLLYSHLSSHTSLLIPTSKLHLRDSPHTSAPHHLRTNMATQRMLLPLVINCSK